MVVSYHCLKKKREETHLENSNVPRRCSGINLHTRDLTSLGAARAGVLGVGMGFCLQLGEDPALSQVGPAGACGEGPAGKTQKLEEGSGNSCWKVRKVSEEERAFEKV